MRFEKDVQKAKLFLKELATRLGFDDDQERADRILRATLRVLRRRIAPQEYLDFIAQLPICIKAEAVDGWKLSAFPDKSIRTVEDFVEAAKAQDKRAGAHDFGSEEEAKAIVKGTFAFLKDHVSQGEFNDLLAELPEPMKVFLQEA